MEDQRMWSQGSWWLYKIDSESREMYLLMAENARLAHMALSGEELERLADFLDRIVEEVDDMQEQQVVDDVDRGGKPPFLVARSYNELSWLIEFYAAPDYEEAAPTKTLSLSNVKIRDWVEEEFLNV